MSDTPVQTVTIYRCGGVWCYEAWTGVDTECDTLEWNDDVPEAEAIAEAQRLFPGAAVTVPSRARGET